MRVFGYVILTGVLAMPAFAHGSGLNAQGCHTNRKTGDYHCHRAQSSQPATRPRSDQSSSARQNFNQPATEANRTSFRNCAEARAAGAAPVRRGDAGYGSHLDRDNDGIGCE